MRNRRWTRCKPPRPLRNEWLRRAGRGQFGTSAFLELVLESRLRRLELWREDLRGLVAILDSFVEPFGLEGEYELEPVPGDEKATAEQSTVSGFQQFTIDPESLRIVVDGRIYTISGSVIGPAAAHTRIRVWLGNRATGLKLRDPTLGTETLVSGNFIVDLPGGHNSFSLVIDAFQLSANIPQPPTPADPWVVTASATGGQAESNPVLLPPPEYAYPATTSQNAFGDDPADPESIGAEAPQPPTITAPPSGGVVVQGVTAYEIKGVQAASPSALLIQAWPLANREKITDSPSFATVLYPGDTSFSVLVKLSLEGSNQFVASATDLNSGLESALAVVPSITRREKSTGGGAASSRSADIVAVKGNGEARTPRHRRRRGSTGQATY